MPACQKSSCETEGAKSLLLKGGAPVRTLGRRIVFWRSQNVRSKQGVRDFCGAGRPRPAKSIRWREWRAGVVAPHGWAETLFTSYVLLRKTQSSVSLRLTAPFQRSLFPAGDGGCVLPGTCVGQGLCPCLTSFSSLPAPKNFGSCTQMYNFCPPSPYQ